MALALALALYYRFKSAKQFTRLPISERYMSIGEFKDRIFESKIGKGKDFDLMITDAETNVDYIDESTMIPANTHLLIRRIPGWSMKPIVISAPVSVENEPNLKEKPKKDSDQPKAAAAFIQDSEEWDEFFSSNSWSSSSIVTTAHDDMKDSKNCTSGISGRITGRNIPQPGYVCRRCNVAGHFIQHCPTNGDPDYDFKKKVAVLDPDEATFRKEIEGIQQRSVNDIIPPELCCKLCKKIMEYAVMSSKCCFDSFCDQCIRNYIISNSACVCGATDILTDYLLPNLTLRNAIDRITNAPDNYGHSKYALQIPTHMAKVPSSAQSLASNKKDFIVAANKEENSATTPTKDAAAPEDSDKSEVSKNDEDNGEATTKEPIDVGETQWNSAQNLEAKNYMMSMAFNAYNPYWNWAAADQGFRIPDPYAAALAPCPYMNSWVGPPNMSYGGLLPQGQHSVPPMTSRRSREFEASKTAPKKKHESMKEHHDRGVFRGDISSKKFKSNHHRSERACPDRRDRA